MALSKMLGHLKLLVRLPKQQLLYLGKILYKSKYEKETEDNKNKRVTLNCSFPVWSPVVQYKKNPGKAQIYQVLKYHFKKQKKKRKKIKEIPKEEQEKKINYEIKKCVFQQFSIPAFQQLGLSAFQHVRNSAFQHFSISESYQFSISEVQHFRILEILVFSILAVQ